MLVCNLHKFRIENSVDAKYLLSSTTPGEYTGVVLIKRGKETFKSPQRKLHTDTDGNKSISLASSFEISDVREARRSPAFDASSNSTGGGDHGLALTASESNLFSESAIRDHEADVISMSVRLYSRSGMQIYNVRGFLNISDYKKRPEKRHEISLKMYKQPLMAASNGFHYGDDDSSLVNGTRAADGALSMHLVYSHDNEHPSLLNFIACGLFLCPATTPLDRGSSSGGGFGASAEDRSDQKTLTDACMNMTLCASSHDVSAGETAVEYSGGMTDEKSDGVAAENNVDKKEKGEAYDFFRSFRDWPARETVAEAQPQPDLQKTR